jgi:hypothetical protein
LLLGGGALGDEHRGFSSVDRWLEFDSSNCVDDNVVIP